MSFSLLLDFLFPRKSLSNDEGAWITPLELNHLTLHPQFYDAQGCRDLGLPELDSLFAMSTYRDCPLLRKALHTFKFKRMRSIGVLLGEVMAKSVADHGGVTYPKSHLCPVPLHWSRKFHRGFNQADILAKTVSLKMSLPLCSCIRRIRPTGHQSHRSKKERQNALRGAFRVSASRLPTSVILVDDVCTTGSTLRECASVLRQSGISHVVAIVCAHDANR